MSSIRIVLVMPAMAREIVRELLVSQEDMEIVSERGLDESEMREIESINPDVVLVGDGASMDVWSARLLQARARMKVIHLWGNGPLVNVHLLQPSRRSLGRIGRQELVTEIRQLAESPDPITTDRLQGSGSDSDEAALEPPSTGG